MHKKILLILCIQQFNVVCNNIFLTSIPKSGTFILVKLITAITKKTVTSCSYDLDKDDLPDITDHQFIGWHVPYSQNAENKLVEKNYKSFFLYRDPRDQLISYLLFNLNMQNNQILSPQHPRLYPMDFDELLNLVITNVKKFYHSYIGWIKCNKICSIKFEDIIGQKGGGSCTLQKNALKKIFQHLEIQFDDDMINYWVENLFGDTATFREGKIGSWKKYFTPQHKELFKSVAGQLLIELGYEKDFNW